MGEKKRISKFEQGFSVIVIFTTVLVLYILAIELFFDTSKIQDVLFYLDIGITIVFLIDLYFLYQRSIRTKDFVRNNWLDIISVIPFGMAFRLTKLVRTIKLLKVFTRSSRLSKISKTTKISKGLRIKSQIPRTGKLLSKLPKEKMDKKK